jgi:hypothetical protein
MKSSLGCLATLRLCTRLCKINQGQYTAAACKDTHQHVSYAHPLTGRALLTLHPQFAHPGTQVG